MRTNEILEHRQKQYGDATQNFKKIGIIWGQLLNLPYSIAPHEVALMMVAMKTVRASVNPELEDSWIDIQGYAEHGWRSL